MTDERHGNNAERVAVKLACDALTRLNKTLEGCRTLGIDCRLEKHGDGFLAEFTKTTTIYPGS